MFRTKILPLRMIAFLRSILGRKRTPQTRPRGCDVWVLTSWAREREWKIDRWQVRRGRQGDSHESDAGRFDAAAQSNLPHGLISAATSHGS
jgi:hypothetical protein